MKAERKWSSWRWMKGLTYHRWSSDGPSTNIRESKSSSNVHSKWIHQYPILNNDSLCDVFIIWWESVISGCRYIGSKNMGVEKSWLLSSFVTSRFDGNSLYRGSEICTRAYGNQDFSFVISRFLRGFVSSEFYCTAIKFFSLADHKICLNFLELALCSRILGPKIHVTEPHHHLVHVFH